MADARTVLVVEDDEALRELLAEILTSEGLAVLEAADGPRGLRLAQEHEPSLVLTDQSLPGMSGLELLEQLRARSVTRRIPVVVVSGRALEPGVPRPDGVVTKPFDVDTLLDHVNWALDGSKQPGPD